MYYCSGLYYTMEQIATASELNEFLPYSVVLKRLTPSTNVEVGLNGDEEFDWSGERHEFSYKVIYEKVMDEIGDEMVICELPEVIRGFNVLIVHQRNIDNRSTQIEGCPFVSLYTSVYLLQLHQRELSLRVLNGADEKYIEAVNRKVADIESDIDSKLSGVSQSIEVACEANAYAKIV